ncbi:putative glycoside hydrolase family 31 protein [Phaeoacremonium minimum UCRPA7]|uniref:alpha-D-xyloside xylohydrolase n=1 Tax=Phaeoacremonium minimum (strain UCR-PA7) TaxID=1286976 RepID=R8BSM2_PHAM7|nr:putative glycoside hydrolase family 31 protein [Phaeoacremonium minimum UCRPA7]EOO02295.1 putative glycoside hydrolase family 31 protein [Phaeoacremonium minimum UCRPA7]
MVRLRDGMWLPAEQLRAEYAEDVYEITPQEDQQAMSLLCPTKHINSRGDTLNQPTVTLGVKAELDGVISIEATHWAGAQNKGPHFELYPDGKPSVQGRIVKSDKGTTLESGSLAITVHPDPQNFNLEFHSTDRSKHLTTLANRSVGFAYSPSPSSPMQLGDMRDFKHYMFFQTNLGVGESVHGLGERFGAWNKVGQTVNLWNADGGTSSDQAYKNVSFWMSNRGYGVFIDTPGRVEMEIGSERSCRVQTTVESQRLKMYIIYGPGPKDVLKKYSILTGKAGKVPSWSFGLWLTTSFTTNYDEATVNSFLEGMKARGSPVDVFHYDCFWMKAFTWTDFVFDSERFPDPKGQIARLKESGLCKKVCVWINPYIAQHGAAFQHAADKGYLLKRKNGDVWQWDLWQAGMGLLDVTNPEAVKWYVECLNGLFDKGVDAIKTDFGERIPTKDVQWFDPTVDPHKMHNYYAFAYNRIVYEALQKRYGKDEAVLFARSAVAGCQRFPLQWGGDCESTPEALAETVRGGLSMGMSGFCYWSCDIGGFEGYPPPWIYKRWVAMGLLCSHSRLHGSNSYRVPWTVDNDDKTEEGCSRTLAKWTALKTRLMPYILSQAAESREGGIPLSLRSVAFEFPDDPTAWYLDRQFMMGSQLLVAPIFEESGDVEFYLPKGKWTSFFTNEVKTGPGWFKEHHNFGSLPLYVRENTVLVLGNRQAVGAVYDYFKDAEVALYQAAPGAKAVLVGGTGDTVGELVVGSDGRLQGTSGLTGAVVVSDAGRSLEGDAPVSITAL